MASPLLATKFRRDFCNEGCTLIVEAVDGAMTSMGAISTAPMSQIIFTAYRVQSTITLVADSRSVCSLDSGSLTRLSAAFTVSVPTPLPTDLSSSVSTSFLSFIGRPLCFGQLANNLDFSIVDASQSTINLVPSGLAANTETTFAAQSNSSRVTTARATSATIGVQTPNQPASSGDELNLGERVGIGLGVAFFVIILIMGFGIMMFQRRRWSLSRVNSQRNRDGDGQGFVVKPELGGVPKFELDGRDTYGRELDSTARVEMSGTAEASELVVTERRELDAGFGGSELEAGAAASATK